MLFAFTYTIHKILGCSFCTSKLHKEVLITIYYLTLVGYDEF